MSPRRYKMDGKRASDLIGTRQRIVEATLHLHGQNGIFGTSWKDIAREADVSVGTVYKHFPDLDALIPACGELLMERVRPPQPDQIGDILAGATDACDRLERVAATLFAFYERGGRHLDSDLRERELPAMREWEDYLRALVAGFVREAIAGHGGDGDDAGKLLFLFDFPTFRSLRIRGTTPDDAARIVAGLADAWLKAAKSGLPAANDPPDSGAI